MDSIINEQKFLQFYDKNVTKIYRYIYFRVGSEQVAQDLSSEAFLKTWQYLNDGKDIENISAMVYQVCRNLIADYFRKNGTFPISLENASETDLRESGSELIENAEAGLELDKIKLALAQLKDEYQELIMWHYIDDFSVSEICQVWGKSEGAVRTSLSRAISALRAVLEAREADKP